MFHAKVTSVSQISERQRYIEPQASYYDWKILVWQFWSWTIDLDLEN